MPDLKQTEKVLNFIADNPGDKRSGAAMQKFGLQPQAVQAWKAVRDTPDHPKKAEVRNKVYDTIAENSPGKDPGRLSPGGAGFLNRFAIKNLISNSPDQAQKFLTKQGFDSRIVDGEIEVKKPGEPEYVQLDSPKFDIFDIPDLASDIAEAVATGVGTFFGSIPGAAAGAAAAETVRQGVGLATGVREDFEPIEVLDATELGLIGGVGGKVVGKGLKFFGDKIGSLIGRIVKPKEAAEEIIAATKEIGGEAVAGQLLDNQLVQKLTAQLAENPGTLAGQALRKNVAKNFDAAEKAAQEIVKDASTLSPFEAGLKLTNDFKEIVADRIEPAANIYNKYDKIFKEAKIDSPPEGIIKAIKDEFADVFADDEATNALKSLLSKTDQIDTIDKITKFRTNIRKMASSSQNGNLIGSLKQIYRKTSDSRLEETISLAGVLDNPMLAIKEIKEADAIYKSVADDVKNVFVDRGKVVIGSPKRILENFFEKTKEVNVVNKLLDTNDPRRIKKVKEAFPEIFEVMRESKIGNFLEKSSLKGELNKNNLVKSIGKLPKESANLIFGENGIKKAKALQTYLNSFPGPLNTSKTDVSRSLKEMFNIFSQAGALGRSQLLGLLTNSQLGKNMFQKTGNLLQKPSTIGSFQFGLQQLNNIRPRESQPSIIQPTPSFRGQ